MLDMDILPPRTFIRNNLVLRKADILDTEGGLGVFRRIMSISEPLSLLKNSNPVKIEVIFSS